MGAGHDHGMSAGRTHRTRLLLVLGTTSIVLVIQVVGAWLSGSLALLADAGHMLTDVSGVALAAAAITLAARPADDRRTFGYYRLEILAAAVNAVLLLGIAAFVLISAIRRWDSPPEVDGPLMLAFAALGLVANIVGLLLLRRGAKESLNVRGAYLEVLGDALGSVAVIVAGLVIVTTGWWRADVVASIAVALLILPRTWSLLKAAVDVLLESTPTDLTMDEVREHILGVDGVEAVHDLHAWTLTSGMPVLSAHVIVDDAVLAEGRSSDVLAALNECLHDHFDVKHCTFQLEPHHFGAQESLTHR